MKKEVISKKQMQLLIFIYPIGSYLLFNMGSKVKQDAWIASIIGILISIPVLMMFGRLMNLYPGKNLFDILEIVFGKVFSKILNLIFTCHCIFLAAYILNNFIDFINITSLWNTPKIILMLCIAILIIFMLKEGINVLADWVKLNIRFIILFLILSGILLIPKMDFSNIQPIFSHSFNEILDASVSLAVYPFIELFVFVGFFDCLEETSVKNIFIKPLIFSGLFVSSIMIADLLLLGGEEYSLFYYSGYEAFKKMRLMGEYQRVEVVVSIIFTIVRFLELNYCLLGASKGVQRLFNLDNYRNTLVPVVFFAMNFAYIIFGSVMDSMDFVANLWTLYGSLLQVALPSIIFIVALIKKKFFLNSS